MAPTKHGLSRTPEYHCWAQIKARCLNPNCRAYPDYGGRGITLHPAWVSDFKAFYDHVGPRPSDDHTLDRIEVHGNYEPGNLRWATWLEQAVNKRPSKKRGTKPDHIGLPGVERRGGQTNYKHGMIDTPEYRCWTQIKVRCYNPNHPAYADYGGRGIGMHAAWRQDFKAFYDHVGPRPSPAHSIDRFPNKDGNYEPGNLRWATKAEQSANRRPCKTGSTHGNTRHGASKGPAYISWAGMQTRCYNPNYDGYHRYGGAGISTCSRWRESFPAFLEDMGPRPSADHVLSRKDTESHFSCGKCPECTSKGWNANCVWMRKLERNRTRKTIKLTPLKAAKIRSDLASGVKPDELMKRYGVARSLVEKIGRGEVWA